MTAVDEHWANHMVIEQDFTSPADSLAYLDWRDAEYRLFHELMGLWGDHSEHTVLDYGCGPGSDLVGFHVYGHAREAIGMDVSKPALAAARKRLRLHGVRATLVRVHDSKPVIPLPDASIDHIYCQGVLHHVSHPAEILREFRRVLKPDGTAVVMVYNPDSAYIALCFVSQEEFVAGADCAAPIVRLWTQAEFRAMCEDAGFQVEYRGGYYTRDELAAWESGRRLPQFHDVDGMPYFDGRSAGLGSVYWLTR